MTIDRSGEWWTGTEFADVAQYLREYTAEGYPADEIVQSICPCGHTLFRLEGNCEEGVVRRTCASCGTPAFVADSDEYWEDAQTEEVSCPACGEQLFEVGVAFSKRADGDVKWITIGHRCASCNVLGSYAEWKIDYSPTDHLLRQV